MTTAQFFAMYSMALSGAGAIILYFSGPLPFRHASFGSDKLNAANAKIRKRNAVRRRVRPLGLIFVLASVALQFYRAFI